MLISLIITTYNRSDALQVVLEALLQQTDLAFEMIIADDGSTQETTDLIASIQQKSPVNIQHVWHQDYGFRAATIRNSAISASKGDYIIFLDGDCIPRPDFIARHRKLAEVGYYVGGNRILFSKQFTEDFLAHPVSVGSFYWWQYSKLHWQGKINRWLTLFYLPIGYLRYLQPQRWRGIKTSNLAVWKKDLLRINGFDTSYQGWGYEDSDLVIRLIRAGLKHKSGRFATTVMHLWHPIGSRDQEQTNLERFLMMKKGSVIVAKEGLSTPS